MFMCDYLVAGTDEGDATTCGDVDGGWTGDATTTMRAVMLMMTWTAAVNHAFKKSTSVTVRGAVAWFGPILAGLGKPKPSFTSSSLKVSLPRVRRATGLKNTGCGVRCLGL